MFTRTTARRSGHSQLYLALVIFSLWAAVTQGQAPQKQCAAFNEYCQNHWDCCSNSCMSYLYRCTRNYGNQGNFFPYEFFGISSYPLQSTLDDIIELNFGNSIQQQPQQQQPQRPAGFHSRFSENDLDQEKVPQASTGATITSKPAAPTTQATKISANKVTAAEVTAAEVTTAEVTAAEVITTITSRTPTAPVLAVTTPAINSRHQAETTAQQPLPQAGNKAADIEATTAFAAPETTTAAAAQVGACKEIGAKCYSHDECCTKRCHGFLHQCVT